MMSQNEGDVRKVAQEVGDALCAPHKDGDRIPAYFVRHRKFESTEKHLNEFLGMGCRPKFVREATWRVS